jgi:hypothetical protein
MSVDHLIPRGQTVNRPRGRLVRITLNEVQSEGLREMARHGILGGKASEVARFLLMEGLLQHAWCAYPQIGGADKTRGRAA